MCSSYCGSRILNDEKSRIKRSFYFHCFPTLSDKPTIVGKKKSLHALWNSSVSPPVFRSSTMCKEGATSNTWNWKEINCTETILTWYSQIWELLIIQEFEIYKRQPPIFLNFNVYGITQYLSCNRKVALPSSFVTLQLHLEWLEIKKDIHRNFELV